MPIGPAHRVLDVHPLSAHLPPGDERPSVTFHGEDKTLSENGKPEEFRAFSGSDVEFGANATRYCLFRKPIACVLWGKRDEPPPTNVDRSRGRGAGAQAPRGRPNGPSKEEGHSVEDLLPTAEPTSREVARRLGNEFANFVAQLGEEDNSFAERLGPKMRPALRQRYLHDNDVGLFRN